MSFISVSSSFIITLFLSETKIHTLSRQPVNFVQYVKTSLNFFKSNTQIMLVIFSSMLIAACVIYVDEFWQIYLDKLLIPVIFFGIFSSLSSFVRIPGSLLSFKLKTKLGYRTTFVILFVMVIISLFTMTFVKGPAGIVSILIIFIFEGLVEPLSSGYLHHRVSSSTRATIDSFQSLIQRVLSILIGLGFGWVAVKISFFAGYGFILVFCAIYLILFVVVTKKIKL